MAADPLVELVGITKNFVTALGEPLRQAIERAVLAACPPDFRRDLAIRLGVLGAYAGAVGAASLWREEGHQ